MRPKVEYRSTSREVFNKFKRKHPEVEINFLEWCNIIYLFNNTFRDYCLETGFRIKFPYGIGDFAVTKYKGKRVKLNGKGEEVVNYPIDWKKSNEMGKTIFHMNFETEGFKFRWLWFYKTGRFKSAEVFTFKPSRISSRLIKHYISKGHHTQYLEWK